MLFKEGKEMTPKEFYNLDEQKQAETIWDGKFISYRQTNEYAILLYQVQNLYVEVYYHKCCNTITKFEAVTKAELLAIYLSKD